jgi:hypothetical protein
MDLKVNLATVKVTIALVGQAIKAMPLCNQYFQGFIQRDQREDAKVEVRIVGKPDSRFLLEQKARYAIFEQLLPTGDVADWLRKSSEHIEDFPVNEKTISSSCLGGILLFNPDTSAGRIYLLDHGPRRFQPLYRLLWMYFAQVLGERGGCFLHAAGLVHDGKGYLFMGESGAGKSTFATLCPECRVLSDDGPILFKQNGQFNVYPSPYHQILHAKDLDEAFINMRARLMDLYFLIKDDQLLVEEVSKGKAFLMVLTRYIHFFSYLSNEAKKRLFNLLFEACSKIPAYYLHFRRDERVWRVIRDQ